MGKCLFTKLQGIVNNTDLPYFNSIKLHVVSNNLIGAYRRDGFKGASKFIFTGDGHLTDSHGTPNDDGLFFSTGTYDVIILFKSDITSINIGDLGSLNNWGNNSNIGIDIADFNYLANCTNLIINTGSIVGGDFSQVVGLQKLQVINIANSNLGMEVVDFIKGNFINSGIQSGSMTLVAFNQWKKSTFNGTNASTFNADSSVTWDSTSIKLIKTSDGTVQASVNL